MEASPLQLPPSSPPPPAPPSPLPLPQDWRERERRGLYSRETSRGATIPDCEPSWLGVGVGEVPAGRRHPTTVLPVTRALNGTKKGSFLGVLVGLGSGDDDGGGGSVFFSWGQLSETSGCLRKLYVLASITFPMVVT